MPDSYEGFYKAVFENSQRAIISTNAEATVLCHNSPFNCLMGAEAGSLSGQPLEKIVAFDDMSGRSFFDTLSAAAQSQDTVFAQLLSNSQQPVPVRLEVMEAKDASGVSGYVIFADDMSRIDGQKEFLNSVISLQAQGNLSFEELARALFSECQRVFGFEQAGMISISKSGAHLVLCSDEARSESFFSAWHQTFPEQAKGQDQAPLLPETDLHDYAKAELLSLPIFIENCFWGYIVLRAESPAQLTRFLRQRTFIKGIIMWVSSRLSEHLSHAALLASNRALEEREQLFRDLYRSTPAMMHAVDDAMIITEVSDLWLKNMGYERHEVIGKKSTDFSTEASRHFAQTKIIPEFFATGALSNVPYTVVRKDGSLIEIELSAVRTKLPDGKTSSLAVMTDVGMRNRAIKDLENRSQSLRKANDSLRKFTYIASHDFQEPLRKLQQYSYLLVNECEQSLSAEGQEYLEVITSASKRMSALINDLLLYSRTTNALPDLREIDLNAMIENALQHEEALQPKGFDYEVSCDILPNIYADQLQVQRLLRSIFSNSFKFASRDRKLSLTIRLEHDVQEGGYILRITDTGIGFEARYEEKIFEPLQKLHAARLYKGTGMGLAIVKAICDNHNWRVSALGVSDVGTTLVLHLPISSIVSEA